MITIPAHSQMEPEVQRGYIRGDRKCNAKCVQLWRNVCARGRRGPLREETEIDECLVSSTITTQRRIILLTEIADYNFFVNSSCFSFSFFSSIFSFLLNVCVAILA